MSSPQQLVVRNARVVLLLFLAGCVSVKWGNPIPIEALKKLEVGTSTHADILLTLGQPRGTGVVSAGEDRVPRELLFYEYLTGDSKSVNLEIMLVFVARDRYDGHVWFAATERIRKEGGVPGVRAAEKAETGAFPDPAPLENAFRRGETTRDEVLETLGQPAGTGGALFPPAHRASEVLYYEHLAVDDAKQSGDEITYRVHQQIMLVLLVDGRFDAFLWYTTPQDATAGSR